MGKSKKRAPSLSRAVGATLRTLTHDLFDTYHPERHYMRGPGPKWREKHAHEQPSQGYASTGSAMRPAHV